jgi:hypothetical protein
MPLLESFGSASSRGSGMFGKVTLGLTSASAVFSAKEIYESGVTTNGNYWVKGNGSTPRQVYCLMDRRGGGWTRVMRIQRDYNGGTNNFYTSNIGSSFDSSVSTTFNLAASLFGNNFGSDLSVMYRVVGSGGSAGSAFPGAQGGAIFRGYALTDAWDMSKDSGTLATDGDPEYSTDGLTFTNYTNSYPLAKANNQWNIVHANFSEGVGFYGLDNQSSGFILGHGGPLGINFLQQNYGFIEGHGVVGGEGTWSYVDVYIRKDR